MSESKEVLLCFGLSYCFSVKTEQIPKDPNMHKQSHNVIEELHRPKDL